MLRLNRRIVNSVACLVMLMALLLATRPKLVFDEEGHPREFGFGKGQTIYSLGMLSSCAAIVMFYYFSVMDMIYES